MTFLTLEHFAERINDSFISLGDENAVFVLLEASALQGATPEATQRGPFSLLFRNSSAILFEQKIFQMQHEVLGVMGIFLVPVARDSEGFLYQAVFN